MKPWVPGTTVGPRDHNGSRGMQWECNGSGTKIFPRHQNGGAMGLGDRKLGPKNCYGCWDHDGSRGPQKVSDHKGAQFKGPT